MSFHSRMKRFCPGAPNRYSTSESLSVRRPKSMATVVVVLSGTPARSSISSPACVMTSSVRSGRISESVPTNVVLPTAKCPTIRILTAVVTVSAT